MAKLKSILIAGVAAGALAVTVQAISAQQQDKYTVAVPGGLSFAEFKGYEGWQTISISHSGAVMAVILGNPIMIKAFQEGIPENGKPFPDGAMMAKPHYTTKTPNIPGNPVVPAAQHDVDFMVKDSKRFADTGGWGYAEFEYEPEAGIFRPGNTKDYPPQANDAKCGAACHLAAKSRDYVFTEYQRR